MPSMSQCSRRAPATQPHSFPYSALPREILEKLLELCCTTNRGRHICGRLGRAREGVQESPLLGGAVDAAVLRLARDLDHLGRHLRQQGDGDEPSIDACPAPPIRGHYTHYDELSLALRSAIEQFLGDEPANDWVIMRQREAALYYRPRRSRPHQRTVGARS
jgi:hypothetical protein